MHSLKFFIQYFSLQRANFSFQIGEKEKSSHRKRRIENPRRDVNPPFIARISSEEEEEETLGKDKNEEFSHHVRGTPTIYRLLFLICKREVLIRGVTSEEGRGNTKAAPTHTGKNRFFLPP